MQKRTIIILGLILLSFVGVWIYFAAGVSSVHSPIKKYEYLGSFDQLISGIQKYSSANPDVNYKITDTVGNRDNGYTIYMTIEMRSNRRNIMYELKCEKMKSKGEPATTEIKLVGAHDMINKTTGYKIDDTGVKELVNYFDADFLVPLKTSQNININPY